MRYDLLMRWWSFSRWFRERRAVILWITVPVLVLAFVVLPPVRDWADNHVGAMTAVAAIVAAIYAGLTYSLVVHAAATVAVTREQRYDSTLPMLIIKLLDNPHVNHFGVELRNVGNGLALNVELWLGAPNIVKEGMTESVRTPPIHFSYDHLERVVIPKGDTRTVTFRHGNSKEDILADLAAHPLYDGDNSELQLGTLRAKYEDIHQREIVSTGAILWRVREDKVVLDGMSIRQPMRYSRRPIIPANQWYSRPYWLRRRRPINEDGEAEDMRGPANFTRQQVRLLREADLTVRDSPTFADVEAAISQRGWTLTLSPDRYRPIEAKIADATQVGAARELGQSSGNTAGEAITRAVMYAVQNARWRA